MPLHAPDLELPKADRYHVHTVHSFDDISFDELGDRISDLENHVLASDMGLELLQEGCLDMTYSLVKYVPLLCLCRVRGDYSKRPVLMLLFGVPRKLPVLTEPIRMRVVEMLAAFVSNTTDGILAARLGSDREESVTCRSAFKASVYFLITALSSISQILQQAEKDILKKGKVRTVYSRIVCWDTHSVCDCPPRMIRKAKRRRSTASTGRKW